MINKIILVLCCFLIISCATEYTKSDYSRYDEKIESFLITNDGKQLVIIGKEFHYIFALDTNLQEILLSEKRKGIQPYFQTTTVDIDNKVTSFFDLESKGEDTKWLTDHKFQKTNAKTDTFKYHGKLVGMRYRAKETLPNKYKFNQEYKLNVTVLDSKATSAMKTLLTPVAIAADLTIAVGVIGTLFIFHEASLITGNGGWPK